ncbi:type VI secretion system-associated protein [Novosphingobium sp. PC22D]|uniref:type VI secretion system baseplate subunit TssK n=1 Tax=Novosphingobium sp. PC22D TaxID=1962403 RepID=UPI000BF14BBF|nr:type VI secretion system baseplate subunit TssK [Novosphingobium sp. PC22D]PEQ14575.1 type VI secretion system-associated protein [Novosphingobium sp. PC22D]
MLLAQDHTGGGRLSQSNRVAWREGMFLRPHHFQAQDRHFTALLNMRLNAAQPWNWGVTELVIDEDLASIGKFAVSRCSGIMPDGTPFSIPGSMPPPEPIDIPADARDALVSLTIPAQQDGALEFCEAREPRAVDARFVVDEDDVLDSFADERIVEQLEFGRPNLRFGVSREQLYGRITLGLARIREVENKAVRFDGRYIPPTLDIASSHALQGGLVDIIGRAEQRAGELALRAVEATEGGAETFASFLLLQALNRWIPHLQHLEAMPMIHPERLYQSLGSFAGELATLIRSDRKPPALPRYDHENPETCFSVVYSLLQSMLSAVFERSAVQLPLKQVGPGAYAATITDHSQFRTGYFFLAVSALANVEEIRAAFPSVVKIATLQKIQSMVDSSLVGVPIRHTPTPPPQIRVLPGYVYFELDRGVPEWDEFQSTPALCMHVAGDWHDLKLELWCVKSERS